MSDDLMTRLRKWHAANPPDYNNPHDPTDIKDMVPEAITYIEDLEVALHELSALSMPIVRKIAGEALGKKQ